MGTNDAIIYTWNGAAVANTLNFEANFGVPAGKHVTCLASTGRLFVGVASVAEMWSHDGAAWAQIVDATAANITYVHDICIWDNYVFCCASDSVGGAGAAGTEIWRWDYIAAGAAPTAAVYTFSAGFVGTNLSMFQNGYLICSGYNSSTGGPALYYSADYGASWTSASVPSPYNVEDGSVVATVELEDYLYAVVSEGNPAANLNVYRTSNLSTWEKSAVYSTFVPALHSAISFGGELFVGGAPATGAVATEYYHFDGTSWEKVEADAGLRTVKSFAYYTDGVSSTPTLWLIGADDLLSYDSATETWTVEDTGAIASDYSSVKGPLEPAPTAPSWNIPATGSGLTLTTTLGVEGTGLTAVMKIYKDSVDDTANWAIHYNMDWEDGKLKFKMTRSSLLSTTTLNTIDIYVLGQDSTWYVIRTAYYGAATATANTSGIKKGESVRHLGDGKQYYVKQVKNVTTTSRSLFLLGSGGYNETWASSTSVIRTTFGPSFVGLELGLGAPPGSPP